jgi:DNA-binding NarL/FixJ family response regulator
LISVLLVDDHPLVRTGIRKYLTKEDDLCVVGEASDGNEALTLIEALDPDVILLDMELPGLNGVEVARQIQLLGWQVQILALSGYRDEQYIQGLLTTGIKGYMTKDEPLERIVAAIRGVARGEPGWISRKVLNEMSRCTNKKGDFLQMGLTRREAEVIKIVAGGKTNQEVAVSLGISEKTVERHVKVIFTKLGVVSRVEAAVKVVRAGLV